MARVTMLLDNDFTRDHRVLKEARSLVGAGHEVRVVAVRSDETPDEETRDGIAIERVPLPSWTGRAGLAQVTELLRWYERMAPLGDRAAACPADVIHAHDLTTLAPARRAARRLGAALVYDDHELYVETLNTTYPLDRGRLRTWLYRRMAAHLRRAGTRVERRGVRSLDGHVTVSDSIADELARRYRVPRPVVVANCPPRRTPPTPDGRLHRALGAPAGAPVVLYQGTFPASGAGQEDLVDAAAHLPEGARVAFLGWGFGQAMLERRAREKGVADRVTFLPPVSPDELPLWIAEADVAAVPNRAVNLSNLLALPNKLFEAMMCGVPVVAADTPEVRRVLDRYPAGKLHEMGDVAGLAAGVRAILEAPSDVRDAFRLACRRATEETYCWERQEERLLGLYEGILARREGACSSGS
jgi:glycosyltransferase involved in cell wall biosynthesis